MGLLDFQDDTDDFMFSNFDAGFTSTAKASQSQEHTPPPACSASTESVLTNESTSTTASTSPDTSPTSPAPRMKPSSTNRRRSKSKPLRKPSLIKSLSPGFDLYGDDDELQSAEPRISYCDKCLKHCDIHEDVTP